MAPNDQSAGPGRADRAAEAIAAHQACRGSVISHESAALLHGLPLVGREPATPSVTVPPTGTGDLRGARLHRAGLPQGHVIEVDGVRLTSVPRTVVDLARARATSVALPTADAALNRRLASTADLDAVLARCANWPGIARAMRTISLADAAAESPLESLSRFVLHRLGLAMPVLQQRIGDATGAFLGRLDFYWDQYGVGGEADGVEKYGLRASALHEEKLRQENLEDHRLVVVRWGWEDIVNRPRLVLARVHAAFDRARALDRAGLPRRWSLLDDRTDHSRGKVTGRDG